MLFRRHPGLPRGDYRATNALGLIPHNVNDFPGLVLLHYKIEKLKTSYLTVKHFEESFFLGRKKRPYKSARTIKSWHGVRGSWAIVFFVGVSEGWPLGFEELGGCGRMKSSGQGPWCTDLRALSWFSDTACLWP